LELHTDVLAKGLSQKKAIYLKHLLAGIVRVDNQEMPRDSAITRLLAEYGGARFDYPRSKPSIAAGKITRGPKSAGVKLDGDTLATATLLIRHPEQGTVLSKSKTMPSVLSIVFSKTNGLWEIVSMEWKER